MAKKKAVKNIKVKIEAAKATPAPPLGPALGQAGINIAEFVKKYNDATAKKAGKGKLIAKISVFEDRTYDFKVGTTQATELILKKIGLEKGSQKPGSTKAGKISMAQLRELAEVKMEDLNATTVEAAAKILAGSARSMGLEVTN
jgi:large subunit ribosomal protein L11